MNTRNTLLTLFVLLTLVAIGSMEYRANAAALTPPSGWLPTRERMGYALGRIYVSVGAATGTTEIAVTGLTATDHVLGICNLSDPSEAQIATSAITAATGKITFSAGSTNAELYQVIYLRPRGEWAD